MTILEILLLLLSFTFTHKRLGNCISQSLGRKQHAQMSVEENSIAGLLAKVLAAWKASTGLVQRPGVCSVGSWHHLQSEGTGQEMVTGSWREEGPAYKS